MPFIKNIIGNTHTNILQILPYFPFGNHESKTDMKNKVSNMR